MSQTPPASASKSPPASSPPHGEADVLPPNAFSLHNLPHSATWRGVKDVINDVFPCWCMVRIVVPGIANVEVKTAAVASELAAKLQGHDWDGFVLATQPPLSPQQGMMLQHQAMVQHQMHLGMHHPLGYTQYGYPQSPQQYPGAPQYVPYMPQYVGFYPGSPPMTDTYLASTVPDTTSQTASPSANSVSSSGASSLTNSPMPYYVAPVPVGPDWTQPSPMFNMALQPGGFVPYNHVPRMRRFGGYGGYGGYNGAYGGGYKPRVMNYSDTPIDKQRLFVGNIPFATTWYELKAHLGSVGPVAHVEIQTNDVGDSLGFALVTFEDEETARKAIDLFDGKMFEGRALKVHYDRVPPRKHYGAHHNNHNHSGSHGGNMGAPASGSLGSSPAPAAAAAANGYSRYKGFKPFVPGDAGSQV
ncbi:33 kDa ribonucleoprotein [Yarrowia sp. B02]|nr:33 kDa ribonucleoprotein [Yarrowia sp. B02]